MCFHDPEGRGVKERRMVVEFVVLANEVLDVIWGEVQVHARQVGVNRLVRGVKEV